MMTLFKRNTDPTLYGAWEDNGQGVDITGATVQMHLRPEGSEATPTTFAGALVDAASGTFKFTLSAAQTLTVAAGPTEVEVTITISGDKVKSSTGVVLIEQAVDET